MNVQFTGTPKQVKWCTSIYHKFSSLYGQENLPPILSAHWWINHRNDNLADLLKASKLQTQDTPFTSRYPRGTREQAVTTLQTVCTPNSVVCDVETTGIGKGHEIIDIALVSLMGETLFSSLVKPVKAVIQDKAYEVHGITMEDLEDSPTFIEVWPNIEEVLKGSILLTYNGQFDVGMIRRSLDACGVYAPTMDVTCIMKLAQAYFELEDTLKLSEACERLHIDASKYGESHGALADSLTASAVLRGLCIKENLLIKCVSCDNFSTSNISCTHCEEYFCEDCYGSDSDIVCQECWEDILASA